jgi:predicted DNA-binding transcriptional regulator AlpA
MKRKPHFLSGSRIPGMTEEGSLLDSRQVAGFLGIAPATLKWWRLSAQQSGPDFIRVGGVIRYSMQDLRQYLESRTVRSGESKRLSRES